MAKSDVKKVLRQAKDEKQAKECADPKYRLKHKPPFSVKIKMALLKLKMYGQINKILSMPFLDIEDMTEEEEKKLAQMWLQFDLAMEFIRQQNMPAVGSIKNRVKEKKLKAYARGRGKNSAEQGKDKERKSYAGAKYKTTGRTAQAILEKQQGKTAEVKTAPTKQSTTQKEREIDEHVMERDFHTRGR